MKTYYFSDEISWIEARRGKITGSKLGGIISKRNIDKKKQGFYELIAERIGLPADGENPMDRGHRLEEEAIERFEKMTDKKVNCELVLWVKDDNESIALSPDGMIGETEAVEVKCLSSARHIEAYLTGEIPEEYRYQGLQYFVVNEKLEKLYFCFYDPRLKVKDFFIIEMNRSNLTDEINTLEIYQKDTLKEVEEIASKLMEF
ncbi:MAG: YqaJ viral recombinase family protein [Candidatus Paceibacterota bacterium]